MIASLTGRLEHGEPGDLIIDVGGVGYLVHVPMYTLTKLPPAGNEVFLLITTVVREDEISLYGFGSQEEKWLFSLMRNVSGVGPKLALKILSGIDPLRLIEGLGSGDTALLGTISGVGKKLAQRLVVELRDKVGEVGGIVATVGVSAPAEAEAIDALVSLGYPPKTARKAVEAVAADEAQETETLVRQALQRLAVKR